jgi:hypothetical protein
MLGVEGVENTPGSVGRYLWDITGGAFVDGFMGKPTEEQTEAAACKNLVSQSDILLETAKD